MSDYKTNLPDNAPGNVSFKATHIKPQIFKKIGLPDYVERIDKKMGEKQLKLPNGQTYEVWSNFKAWCYEPNIKHPSFKIKLQISNKEGSGFMEITLAEFDELIKDLINWREVNAAAFDLAEKNSLRLIQNHLILKKAEQVLGNPDEDGTILEEMLINKHRIKDDKTEIERLKANLIRYYGLYCQESNPTIRMYWFDHIKSCLPPLKEYLLNIHKFNLAEAQIDELEHIINMCKNQGKPPEEPDKPTDVISPP